MKITYEGFYGFKNSGDDAFVEVCAWGAPKYWHCQNNVFIGKALPKTQCPLNPNMPFGKMKGFDRLNFLINSNNSDYFISAGGSTFMNIPAHSNKKIAFHLKKFNKNLKIGAIGISLGPFKNKSAEKTVVNYLKQMDFLALRDKRSYQYAKSLNLPYDPVNSFDLAALLPLVYKNPFPFSEKKTSRQNTQKKIGLSVCLSESFTGGDVSKENNRIAFFKALVEKINSACDAYFEVFIINGHKDKKEREVSEQVMKNIAQERYSIFSYSKNLHSTWEAVGSCDLMISTRLHAGVFACYSGVPFFMIEYHQKCTDFLDDIGQEKEYRMYDGDVGISDILPIIMKVLEGDYTPPKNILQTIELAKKNFTKTIES